MTITVPATAPAGARPAEPLSFRRSLAGGCRAMAPWLVGVVPFGVTIGVTAAESDLDPIAGWATGPLIYAGSAQLAAIELLDRGAAPAVVVLTVLVINARLVVYSGAMAPHWRDRGPGFRALCAYLLVDPSYAVGADGYAATDDRRAAHAHYLGAALLLWFAWTTAIAAGILAGDALPDTSILSLVVPYYLVAEVVRVSRTRPTVVAGTVAALAALAAHTLPMHSGAVIAIVVGVAVAACLQEPTS